MDVRLNDGTMVKNVPEGTTQDELMSLVGEHKETLAQRAITAVSAKPGEYGIPRGITQFAASSVLPALGTLGGAAAGSLLPGPGTMGGAMAGGALGEAGNQALGITDPSGAAIGLNALGPLVGKIPQAIKGTGQTLSRFLPGAGQALQERAAPMAAAISKVGMPSQTAEALYTQLEGHNPLINAAPFKESLTAMKEEVAQRLGSSSDKMRLLKYLDSKIEAIDKAGGQVPFVSMRATQKEINAKIGAKEGGEELGILSQLAGGIKESFKKSVTEGGGRPEAVALLDQANKAFVKEQGKAELDKAIAAKMVEHEGGAQTFSDKAREGIKKVLNTSKEIKGAYAKEDISQMKEALDAIGTLPGLPPKGDTLFGGLRYSGPAVIGSILAPHMGIHPIVGAAAGMSLDIAMQKIVASPLGRQTVIALAKSSGKKVAPDELMAIAAGLTGGVGGMINPAHGALTRSIQPPGP